MSDPVRLLEQGRDDLAVRLLSSATDDGPDDRSWQRALATVAAASAATSAAAPAAGASALGGVLKWLGIGALAGGVLAAAGTELAGRDAAPPPAATDVRAAVDTDSPAPRGTGQARAEPAPMPAAEVYGGARSAPSVSRTATGASIPAPAAREPAAPGASVAAFDAPEETRDSLAEELAEIDRARARLAAGDTAGALGIVDRYLRTRPRGRFVQEATLVRAEALAASGRCADARAAASVFVQRFPDSVLGKRAKTILARCQ